MKNLKVAALSGLAVVATAVPALAEPMLDFTAMSASITAELGPAITSAMPIAGLLLAVGIGYKLYKRFTK